MTASGETLDIIRVVGNRHVIKLPAGVDEVTIHSRTSAPSSAIGPYVDDRRELGVLVGEITLWDETGLQPVQSHLAASPDTGWFSEAGGRMRWTNGAAHLSLGHRISTASALLTIEIVAAGPYLLAEMAELKLAA